MLEHDKGQLNSQRWKWSRRRRRRRRRRDASADSLWGLGLMVLLASAFPEPISALRCYTDIAATKSQSVECGLNTGCVKIYIDSEEMILRRSQMYGFVFPSEEGAPSLPEKYMDNPILLRGCFVLAVPDRCYTANNGLTYCWCSQKDLCNHAPGSVSLLPIRWMPRFCSCFGMAALLTALHWLAYRLLWSSHS